MPGSGFPAGFAALPRRGAGKASDQRGGCVGRVVARRLEGRGRIGEALLAAALLPAVEEITGLPPGCPRLPPPPGWAFEGMSQSEIPPPPLVQAWCKLAAL